MEITELARRIIQSPDLATKLEAPEVLTDNTPLGSSKDLLNPARSSAIAIGRGEKLGFPKTEHLVGNNKKAQVFHFFANHELLAMELMAQLLLKFPEAPKPFRRGIAQAILEEQQHMQLYLGEMKKYGLEFGELYLNDYFWKTISPIRSPKDFVVKMSLTFEQANLDYSKFFMGEFLKIDDKNSFEVMKRVYEDEIGHVKLGVHWFNKWKNPDEEFWDAYKNELMFPLNPERAKGTTFDKEGRKRAGLDSNFINQMYLYSSSKERPPRVWIFNPEAEEELLSKASAYTPTTDLQQIKKSLQHFLCISALSQDIVMVDELPSEFYLKQLKKTPITLPEFVLYSSYKKLPAELKSHLGEKKVISLHPWAYTEKTIKLGMDIKEFCYQQPPEPEIFTKSLLKNLNSQLTSREFLNEFIEQFPESQDLLISKEDTGIVANNWEDIYEYSKSTLEKGGVVIKAPLSLSGRGLQFISSVERLDQYKNWICSTLKKQGEVIVEPMLDRIFDYSLQMNLNKDRKTLQGTARFVSNQRGRYIGGILGSPLTNVSPDVLKALFQKNENQVSFEELNSKLSEFVQQKFSSLNLDTAIGIDCFVFLNSMGKVKIKPLVEINFRYNMGRLKVDLSKLIKRGRVGIWRVLPKKLFIQTNKSFFTEEHLKSIQLEHPIRVERGHINEGLIWLSDPLNSGEFAAVAIVDKSYEECIKKFEELGVDDFNC